MIEWVVANGWSSFDVLPVLKRSEKQVTAMDNGRVRKFLAGDVIAILPEDRARRLHERLVSSANRARQEVSGANQRHRERVAKLKAEAAA